MVKNMEVQEICAACQAEFTPFICCCSYPPFRICERCFPSHKEKLMAVQPHELIPCPQPRPHDLQNGLYIARRKLLDLTEGENRMKWNLATLSNLEETVVNESDRLIQEIQTHRDKLVETLRNMRMQGAESLDEAGKRVRSHVLDRSYIPANQIEHLLSNYSPSSDPNPQVFNVTMNLPYDAMRRAMNIPVDRTIQVVSSLIDMGGARNNTLAVFHERELHLYDCQTSSWIGAFQLNQEMPTFGRVNVFLSNGNLFHCGGSLNSSHYSSNAYEIDCVSGQISVLPGMSTPRRVHGGVRVGFFIYIFGGKCENAILKSGERFDIAGNRWEALPDMQSERMSFNPVLVNGNIYLLGGCTRVCEEFNIAGNVFSLLAFSLEEASPSISACTGPEEVLIFSSLYVHTWNRTTGAFSSNRANINGSTATEMIPVFINSRIYSSGWKGVKMLKLPSLFVDSIPIPSGANH